MLEEGLSSSTLPPAEPALALLSFLRFELPAGGSAAEARFIRLFPLLCSRVFGPLDAQQQHEVGGWLSRQARWSTVPSNRSGSSSNSGRSSHSPGRSQSRSSIGDKPSEDLNLDPVVQLLAACYSRHPQQRYYNYSNNQRDQSQLHPSVIDAISAETEHRPGVRLALPLSALPQPTQEAILGMLAVDQHAASYSLGSSPILRQHQSRPPAVAPLVRDNVTRLFGHLLRVRPGEQTDLRYYRQRLQQQQSQHHASPTSPMITNRSNTAAGTNTKKTSPPTIMLSMLEYYLFLFVHFPLASPFQGKSQATTDRASTSTTPQQSSNNAYNNASSGVPAPYGAGAGAGIYRSMQSSYGDKVYLHLFRGYVRHYLTHCPASLNTSQNRSFLGFPDLERDSELFLRIVLEFWVEGENVPPTCQQSLERLSQRQRQPDMALFSTNLDSSYDMAFMPSGRGFVSGPSQAQTGIRHLVNHLVADPGIAQAVFSGADSMLMKTNKGAGFIASTPIGGASSMIPNLQEELNYARSPLQSVANTPSSVRGTTSTKSQAWCLSPSMSCAQQSFFNYIRITFRHAPVHVANSPFYTALNAWLVWIEPWNVQVRKAKASVKNFSPTKAKDFLKNSLSVVGGSAQTLSSIITMPNATSASKYTKEWEPYIAANLYMYVVPLAIFLRRALELDFSSREFHNSLKHVQRVFRVFSPEVVNAINHLLASPSHSFASLLTKHEQILGEYCPPKHGNLSLSSCAQDMHNMLEEIFLQHKKTERELDFFDRIASNVNAVAGFGMKGEETSMTRLLQGAKVIANLPHDYEVLPRDVVKAGTSTPEEEVNKPDRVNGVFLTDRGREQIARGSVKCNPLDILKLGDPMTSRVKSYEFVFLVEWTIRLSNWINEKLGLVPRTDDGGELSVGALRASRMHSAEDTTSLLLKLAKEGEVTKHVWFRINLRFLADYRNLSFFVFGYWILSKVFR